MECDRFNCWAGQKEMEHHIVCRKVDFCPAGTDILNLVVDILHSGYSKWPFRYLEMLKVVSASYNIRSDKEHRYNLKRLTVVADVCQQGWDKARRQNIKIFNVLEDDSSATWTFILWLNWNFLACPVCKAWSGNWTVTYNFGINASSLVIRTLWVTYCQLFTKANCFSIIVMLFASLNVFHCFIFPIFKHF